MFFPRRQAFTKVWEELDDDGNQYIDLNSMTTLLASVEPPMGVNGLDRQPFRIQEIVMSADIPIR